MTHSDARHAPSRSRAFVAWLLLTCAAATFALTLIGCTNGRPRAYERPPAVDYYVQAVMAYQRGERDRAIQELVRANEANPNLTMSRVMLGDLYRAGGDYTNAAVQYEAAAKLDPYGYVNHLNLGVSYQLLNRFQEAAASYLKALRLNPGDVESNMNLGLVYLALGQVDDAVHYLEIATTLDPHNAIALANLGVALDAQGSHARAESAYRKSLDLKADQSTTILNLGTNLLSQQKPTEAIAVLRTVVKKSDSASVRKRFGDAFAQAGRYEEAIQEYMACLKLDSRYYPAMNDMGRVLVARYYASSEMDEEMRRLAVRYWRASLQINPSQPRVVTLIKEWDRTRL